MTARLHSVVMSAAIEALPTIRMEGRSSRGRSEEGAPKRVIEGRERDRHRVNLIELF